MKTMSDLPAEIAQLTISEPFEQSQVRYGGLHTLPTALEQPATFTDEAGELLALSLRYQGDSWETLLQGEAINVCTDVGIGSLVVPRWECQCKPSLKEVKGTNHLKRIYLSKTFAVSLCPLTGILWQRTDAQGWECIGESRLDFTDAAVWRVILRLQDTQTFRRFVARGLYSLTLLWSTNPLEIVYPRLYVETVSVTASVAEGYLLFPIHSYTPLLQEGMLLRGTAFGLHLSVQRQEHLSLEKKRDFFGWFCSYRIL